ncbi:TPX2 isoform X1 [Olea europaea subsp. europaea]|uniref:TPX2 isoform X1 n=1 Tax=Olea europaea subsp. europaea TaxID=158383 RepID=A0A8S0RS71_OLEEU|nr:TPX2 isoform X1 [Olea europaea subsp. europaea]
MAVDEISNNLFAMDEAYEFSAPQFYDFIHGETDEDRRKAELWFEITLPHAPSPFMPRIKASRSVQLQSLCNFGEDEQLQKATEPVQTATTSNNTEDAVSEQPDLTKYQEERVAEPKEEAGTNLATVNFDLKKALDVEAVRAENNQSILASENSSSPAKVAQVTDVCTPATMNQTDTKNRQTAKKIASMLRNPSTLNPKNRLHKSQAKSSKAATATRDTKVKNTVGTLNFAQENQAIKRQKLEGGKSRQILTISKPPNLHHKLKPGSDSNPCYLSSTTMKTRKEDRKMYVREPAAPFVSMAEMMKKFQSSTREVTLTRMSSSQSVNEAAGTMQRKPKLTLTRPKTPEFETSQRARSVKIKSSAELEEEMMAKMPKFKARPLNKKILEAPITPALQRSTPQPIEFKEFRLETMSRAIQNSEISIAASTGSTQNRHQWKPNHLTAPKSPLLQTSLRARPPKIKSSEELEKEELEKIPEFKARPLNRKIFESKGGMGIFCNMKKQVTIPQEFHFAIDKRIPPPPPPAAVVDLFDKLSINSEPHHDKPLPRITTPNPFHLHTEERGAEKENRIAMELMQKQLEEEMARIPKALPYPYTTDYPVIPPKPEPKACTKPEPFQLESLLRHEEEMQREIEERRMIEMEEAQMRVFKAQPILKEDPIPVPDKDRKPLTEVQEFNLHVDHRAVDRAEFDKKIKEKEMIYKRYREEAESARMMEEEKALKQLRRTLVPHARPAPKFDNPFLPLKSGREVTKAKSPKLRVDRRKEKRRIVRPAPSTASHMR